MEANSQEMRSGAGETEGQMETELERHKWVLQTKSDSTDQQTWHKTTCLLNSIGTEIWRLWSIAKAFRHDPITVRKWFKLKKNSLVKFICKTRRKLKSKLCTSCGCLSGQDPKWAPGKRQWAFFESFLTLHFLLELPVWLFLFCIKMYQIIRDLHQIIFHYGKTAKDYLLQLLAFVCICFF